MYSVLQILKKIDGEKQILMCYKDKNQNDLLQHFSSVVSLRKLGSHSKQTTRDGKIKGREKQNFFEVH